MPHSRDEFKNYNELTKNSKPDEKGESRNGRKTSVRLRDLNEGMGKGEKRRETWKRLIYCFCLLRLRTRALQETTQTIIGTGAGLDVAFQSLGCLE